jgi:hypothetical protein
MIVFNSLKSSPNMIKAPRSPRSHGFPRESHYATAVEGFRAQTPSADPEQVLPALLRRSNLADIVFPSETHGSYSDLSIAEYRLRFYALVWTAAPNVDAESKLFLILGPVYGSYLPMGTRINVKECNLLLAQPTFQWANSPTYVYTQVFGSWNERFTVEILLPNARPLTLPSLHYRQNQEIGLLS